MEDVIKQSLNAVDEADLSGPPLLERTINPDSDEFEHDLENDSNLVARRFNIHKHTATCRKYRSGEQSCRFGAPWKLVPESYKDEAGVVHIGNGKRTKPYQPLEVILKGNKRLKPTAKISRPPNPSGRMDMYVRDLEDARCSNLTA